MNRILAMAGALALTLAASGCASGPRQSDADRLALYRTHAGEPVESFRFFGSLNGWTPLGEEALAVWTRPGEAFLLELLGPCQDLVFTPAIGLTSNMGRVHSRFDKVLVRNSGASIQMPCHIGTIRPLDVKALRASQKEMREAQVQEREGGTGTP